MKNNQNNSLFRQNAIAALNTHNDVVKNIRIITTRSWYFIILTVIFIATLLVWSLLGEIPITVTVSGITVSKSQLQEANTQISENIHAHEENVRVTKYLFDKKMDLFQQHYLTLSDVDNARKEYLSAKNGLAAALRGDDIAISDNNLSQKYTAQKDMQMIGFIHYTLGKKIRTGMRVNILPNMLSEYQYGTMQGLVQEVSPFPIAKQTAYAYLHNMNVVDEFFSNGAPLFIIVHLIPDANTYSGYAWTNHKGPQFAITPGTFVTAKITTRWCKPIKLVTKPSQCW